MAALLAINPFSNKDKEQYTNHAPFRWTWLNNPKAIAEKDCQIYIVTVETKQKCHHPTHLQYIYSSFFIHKVYVKESFHWVALGGGRENNYSVLLVRSSAATRPAAEDECDDGACCNYFSECGAKPAGSRPSPTVLLSVFPVFVFASVVFLGNYKNKSGKALYCTVQQAGQCNCM